MHSARCLSSIYDSHKNPSQDDLANSKRERFDEDIVDLDSEHDDRMVEKLEGFEEEKLKKLKC